MKYSYVIFDFDGTIADTSEGVMASIIFALESYGYEVPDESVLRKFLGPSLIDGFMNNIGVDEEMAKKLTAKYRELYTDNAMYLLKLFDGIEDLLKELKAEGVKMAIASSKPQHFFDKLLNHLNIKDYFEAVCGADPNDKESSKTEIISNAVRLMGADKDDVLMIGDRCFDILGAQGAGVKSMGVTFGFGERAEFEEYNADYIVDTPEEILQVVL